MFELYSLAEHFLAALEPLGEFFMQPIGDNAIMRAIRQSSGVFAALGNPLAREVYDFITEAMSFPFAYVLFGGALILVVMIRISKLFLDGLPLF